MSKIVDMSGKIAQGGYAYAEGNPC